MIRDRNHAFHINSNPQSHVDRENECFKDNTEANKLVKGFYREPYTIPDLSS